MRINPTPAFAAIMVTIGLHAMPAAAQITDFDEQLIHKAYSPPTPYASGTRVSCNWQGQGRMYSGVIARRFGPTTIRVHYDDGDHETTSINICRLR